MVVAKIKIHDIENALMKHRSKDDKTEEELKALINTEEFIKIYSFLDGRGLSHDKFIKILSIWFEASCEIVEEKINEVNGKRISKKM